MIHNVVTFFTMRGGCRSCKGRVWWVRKSCPACGKEYPTARPVIYWAGIGILVLTFFIAALANFIGWI